MGEPAKPASGGKYMLHANGSVGSSMDSIIAVHYCRSFPGQRVCNEEGDVPT